MAKSIYTERDIASALDALPLCEGDVVFSHSNIGFFGRLEGARSMDDICETFVRLILERIGTSGTLVVPSFTYSFQKGEVFDPDNSVSSMGAFSEWVRKQSSSLRSIDPAFSVVALGARAEELVSNCPINSFGENSFFHRFDQADGAILNLNFDAGSTYLHFIERELAVPYRYDKTFQGTIVTNGVPEPAENTIFVRYLSDDLTAAAFEQFHGVAQGRGDFVTRSIGRGSIGAIRASSCRALLDETLPDRPWLLTKADQAGRAPNLHPE